MRKKLLDYLICPNCKRSLRIKIFKGSLEGEIEQGILTCISCSNYYPIINGIPRFLVGELFEMLRYHHKDWFVKFTNELPENKVSLQDRYNNTNKKKRTSESFGYEWKVWKKLPDYAEQCFLDIVQMPSSFFKNKVGLDVGCGNGRFLLSAAQYVGENGKMVGIDLSEAVESAYIKTRHLENVHIIQADLYFLPFLKSNFDFIYCIGVLQHLPDPQKAIANLSEYLKQRGLLIGTVYTVPDCLLVAIFVKLIKFLRVVTLRFPLKIIYVVSKFLAVFVYLIYKLPKGFLEKSSRYFQDMKDRYPTHENISKPSLNLITHIWFDHLSAPIIGFYSKKEVLPWFESVGLQVINSGQWQGLVRAIKK